MNVCTFWPLDAAQRALLTESQLAASDAQRITLSLRFSGVLDVGRFCDALRWLMLKHPLLRASVRHHDGHPTYAIQESVDLPAKVWSAHDSADYPDDAWLYGDFVLDAAPLWRCGISHDTIDACEVVIVMHHLIADGASLLLMQRELEQAYLGVRAFW